MGGIQSALDSGSFALVEEGGILIERRPSSRRSVSLTRPVRSTASCDLKSGPRVGAHAVYPVPRARAWLRVLDALGEAAQIPCLGTI